MREFSLVGNTILHYQIIEKLGEGGMGVVYKAEDTKLKREVAIKFLPRQIAATEEERVRFKIEAQAAAALNHPNIATVFNIEEVDGEMFIVMEYIKGRELRDVITEKSPEFLKLRGLLDIATQIAAGLQAAHDKGIIHRDIKSANIMVTDKDQVKIMDFGLAKVRGGVQLTQVGTTLGTVAYMSPEQAQGAETDHRTDIWAFGVVLYEMLTGELPFKGDYEQVVIYAILNETPQPLSTLRSETPERLRQLVAQALAKKPAERIQTAADLLASLKEVSEPAQGASRPAKPRNQGSKLRYWYVAVLMGVALAILAGALYFLKTAGTAIDTLAILPFANQSGDAEMAYLGDGIAETLIFKLSQLPNLKVRSLSSVSGYQGQAPDLRKVGDDLNVRAVLSGRVTVRKDNLAIVVELVDARDNSTIWGETYNRTLADLMTVQDEISANILSRLRLELSGETRQKVNKRYTDNAEAYQAYLKGKYFARKRNADDLSKAIKYFRQAIDAAPRYAGAYAGLSEAYFLSWTYGAASRDEALPKAKQAAEKALQIDDTLSEAHAALGLVLSDYNWDFAAAEQELQRAIQLDPNNIDAHHNYSYLLSYTGRHEGAIQEAKTALELDPLSPVMTRGLALVYFFARDYDQALKYYQDCLEINPNSLSATFLLVFVYHEMGIEAQSMAMLAKYLHLIGDKTLAARIEQSYKSSGYRAAILGLLEAKAAGFLTDHTAKSWLFATVGETERCLESLRKAYEERAGFFPFTHMHPAMDPVRSDPRYIAIMDKVFAQQ